MNIQTPRIVQGHNWSVYLWILLVLACALIYWLVSNGLEKANQQLGIDLQEQKQRVAEQEEKIHGLEVERSDLQEQVAALERTSQIDQEATRQVQQELKESLRQRMEIQQELSLFKGIIDNGVQSPGLYIQGFRLQEEDQGNAFRFEFTVSKALKKAGIASGWIFVTLEGEATGVEQRLLLSELTEEKDEKLKMNFKHFQDVEGVIRLPEGFVPHSVLVEIKPKNKSLSPIKKRFGWLVGGGIRG